MVPSCLISFVLLWSGFWVICMLLWLNSFGVVVSLLQFLFVSFVSITSILAPWGTAGYVSHSSSWKIGNSECKLSFLKFCFIMLIFKSEAVITILLASTRCSSAKKVTYLWFRGIHSNTAHQHQRQKQHPCCNVHSGFAVVNKGCFRSSHVLESGSSH